MKLENISKSYIIICVISILSCFFFLITFCSIFFALFYVKITYNFELFNGENSRLFYN